jgi:hypothetical protein
VSVGLVIAAALPLFQLHIIDKLHPFAAPFRSVVWKTMIVAGLGAGVVLLLQRLPFDAGHMGLELILLFLVLVVVLIATLWAALRFALPAEDRAALGPKTAKKLRLI